ncbi:MAG: flagellar motor switch protein FliN [Planctomycetota bacterium]
MPEPETTTQAGSPAPVGLPDFGTAGSAGAPGAIGLLSDVQLQVRIELGRTRMLVEDVLRLNADSVVELDKAAGDPVDIYVNGRRIARGELLVLNENFCVRVSEILETLDG